MSSGKSHVSANFGASVLLCLQSKKREEIVPKRR